MLEEQNSDVTFFAYNQINEIQHAFLANLVFEAILLQCFSSCPTYALSAKIACPRSLSSIKVENIFESCGEALMTTIFFTNLLSPSTFAPIL